MNLSVDLAFVKNSISHVNGKYLEFCLCLFALFCIFPSALFLIEFALNMLKVGFLTFVIFARNVDHVTVIFKRWCSKNDLGLHLFSDREQVTSIPYAEHVQCDTRVIRCLLHVATGRIR